MTRFAARLRAAFLVITQVIAASGCAVPAMRDAVERHAAPAISSRAREEPPPLPAPGADEAERKIDAVVLKALHEKHPVYADPELTRYLRDVAARLIARSDHPDFKVDVVVADTPEPNAWSLCGGHVLVARGALAVMESESELAATLAHEIGHLVGRHSLHAFVVTMTDYRDDDALPFPTRLYDLDTELQADRLAISLLRSAGYATRSLARVLEVLERHSLAQGAGNDPAMGPRLAHIARYTARDEAGEVGRDAYLDHLEGLPVADDLARSRPGARRYRLRVRRAGERGRFDQIAPRVCGKAYSAAALALLNAKQADSLIEPDRRLKCVVEE